MTAGNDRFQRWQKISIDPLGYALNLILTLTIATLGYCVVLLKDRDFAPTFSAKCAMLLSLLALALSAISGFACVFNRLRDFRGTAKRARSDFSSEVPTKEHLDKLGRTTWVLFKFQLFTFAFGVIALAISLLLTYGGKLV
jgi:hypothetical protein